MSDTVVVAIITTIGAVLVALLGVQNVRIGRIRKDAAETREQVANNHKDAHGNPINLRDEQDDRHAENARKLDRITAQNVQIMATQKEHGEAIAALQASDAEHDDRLDEIEHTWDRETVARHRKEES